MFGTHDGGSPQRPSARTREQRQAVKLPAGATKSLETRARLVVDAIPEPAWLALAVRAVPELGQEARRALFPDLLPARPPHRLVGRDEVDGLVRSMVCGQPLEDACRHERRSGRRADRSPAPRRPRRRRRFPAHRGGRRSSRARRRARPGARTHRRERDSSRRTGTASHRPPSTSSRGRYSLPAGLEQRDRGGDADVQRLDAVGERDRDDSGRRSSGRGGGRPSLRIRTRARRRRSGRCPRASHRRLSRPRRPTGGRP